MSHEASGRRPWTGSWVAERLGVALTTTRSPVGVELADLVGLAVRRNPRRAHLLVSTVLGKHVPTDPRLVYGAGRLLGLLVTGALHPDVTADVSSRHRSAAADTGLAEAFSAAVTGVPGAPALLVERVMAHAPDRRRKDVVVLGFAETATGLGHAVADSVGADYLHSTRRPVTGIQPVGNFEEEHSHATSHLLLPTDPHLLTGSRVLVLVDDELSTGQTALNTIAELHRVAPREHYVVAALIDLRTAGDRARMATLAADLEARIDVIALATGLIDLPADVLTRGQRLVAAQPDPTGQFGAGPGVGSVGVNRVTGWPTGVREGGRHGFTQADAAPLAGAASTVVDALVPALAGREVLVLGFEELMYAPARIAVTLAERLDAGGEPPARVRLSTTTRSPVLAVDDPGYAVRTQLVFAAHDDPADGPGLRYAYNVATGIDTTRRFSDIALVIDGPADTPGLHAPDGLLAQLGAHCDQVHLIVLPAVGRPGLPGPLYGPSFGSYAADEVGWLLTDLSHVELEAPTPEREEAIQSGGAHYAESLPVEYQPSPDYQLLYRQALAESAARVAHAVGVVTELVLAARGPGVVLVSLARAGTPVGILMRRWARSQHDLDLRHYAASIVRGKGIDTVALRYLAAQHEPTDVMFVDGWTGKGAIVRELAAAVDRVNLSLGLPPAGGFGTDLAVLADPGHCVEIFGTREDYLIPSACLNSTVSGLVSRTVLNDAYIGPGDFHGAKFYEQLRDADVSVEFLDQVSAHFAEVAPAVARDWPILAAADRAPTWTGWAAVEAISTAYGIDDVNLVKPGVGETTRVLLRRVPWKILVRPGADAELRHVRLLAAQRGVELVEVADLAYTCVGLIHPRFTRGATGADGTAATAAAAADNAATDQAQA